MESQPQNPEFRIYPEPLYPCLRDFASCTLLSVVDYNTNKAQPKSRS